MPRLGRIVYLILATLLLSCSGPSDFSPALDNTLLDAIAVPDGTLDTLEPSHLTLIEKKSRNSAVRVVRPFASGHGSGTYMKMHGQFVVVTAAHVVDDYTTMLIEERDHSRVVGRVIYVDDRSDLAVIHVPPLKSRIAVYYKPKKSNKNLLGANVSYTGFPGHHDLITIRGHVASLERKMIVCNMFEWFGSSGSGVFDARGRFIGVVSGIDVGNWQYPIPLDSIVWVAPAWKFDEDILRLRVKTAPPLESFNSFPGAAAPRRGSPAPR